MKNKVVLFIIWYVLWMLLAWKFDSQHAIAGIVIAGFITFITSDLFAPRIGHFGQISRYAWFCYFVFVFLWECLKANIDVASRVLRKTLPLNPGIVTVKTNLKSDIAITFLGNCLTLAPGTFCVDVDQEKGILYVHWIDVRSQDTNEATRLIVSKFERILQRIFE